MTYRNCKIEADRFNGKMYEWYHPDWVDYDPETGSQWCGYGHTIEECMAQIDDYYQDYARP
jgi:hypothetical protein